MLELIILAFDSTGRHYDETGNFTEWWNDETIEAFQAKAQCFIDQFHEFTVPGLDDQPLHVNGRLTLGENIADAGGLSASFAAWKKLERIKPSQLLPGLQEFSKDQLFFISYANWWCGKTRKESAINRIYRDPHSPLWARILVSWHPRGLILSRGGNTDRSVPIRARWRIRASLNRAFIVLPRSRGVNCGENGIWGCSLFWSLSCIIISCLPVPNARCVLVHFLPYKL